MFYFLVVGMVTMAGTRARADDPCVVDEYTGINTCNPMEDGHIVRMTGDARIDAMTGGHVGIRNDIFNGMKVGEFVEFMEGGMAGALEVLGSEFFESGMLDESSIGTVSGAARVWNMRDESRIESLIGGEEDDEESELVQGLVLFMGDKASIGSVTGGEGDASGLVGYMSGDSRIGTVTGGEGAVSGAVLLMADNASIGILTAGAGSGSGYVGVLGANAGSTARIDLMRSGMVDVMDNKANIDTMQGGIVNTMKGNSSITDMTGGIVVNMNGGEITNMSGTALILEPVTAGAIGNISPSIGALVFGGSAQSRTGAHLFGDIQAGSAAFWVESGGYVRIGDNSSGAASSFGRTLNIMGGLAELENVDFSGNANIYGNGTVRLITSDSDITLGGFGFSGTGGLFDLGQGAYRSATIDSFNSYALSSGTFALRANFNTGDGDLLTINSSSGAASHTLRVRQSGDRQLAQEDNILIVKDLSDRLNFTLGNATDEVVLGNYVYALNNAGVDWELVKGRLAPFYDARASISGAHHGAVAMARTAHGSLHQRLGELRFNNYYAWSSMYPHPGAWARGFGSSTSFKDATTFDTDVYGFEIGLDGPVYSSAAETLVVGVSSGYIWANQDIDGIASKGGESTGNAWFVGLYGTYINDYGVFVDLVGRYMRATADVGFYDDVNSKNEYSLSRNILMASTEIGKHFLLSQYRDYNSGRLISSWFLEPRAQFVYTRLNTGSFTDSAGFEGSIGAANSLLGIAGLSLGYSFRTNPDDLWRLYAKGAYIREFDGAAEVSYNGRQSDTELSGNRFEMGGGIVGQITPAFAVYLDAAYQWGSKSHSSILGNMGLRLSF